MHSFPNPFPLVREFWICILFKQFNFLYNFYTIHVFLCRCCYTFVLLSLCLFASLHTYAKPFFHTVAYAYPFATAAARLSDMSTMRVYGVFGFNPHNRLIFSAQMKSPHHHSAKEDASNLPILNTFRLHVGASPFIVTLPSRNCFVFGKQQLYFWVKVIFSRSLRTTVNKNARTTHTLANINNKYYHFATSEQHI